MLLFLSVGADGLLLPSPSHRVAADPSLSRKRARGEVKQMAKLRPSPTKWEREIGRAHV